MPKSRTQFATVRPRPSTPRLALSIPEFCEAHGISEGFFYKLKKQGEGPREMKAKHSETEADRRSTSNTPRRKMRDQRARTRNSL